MQEAPGSPRISMFDSQELFPKKIRTNETSKSDNEVFNSKDLLMVVILLKKLAYAVGAFNSYSTALMKIVERSFFGTVLFTDRASKLHVLDARSKLAEEQLEYMPEVARLFQKLGEETISRINRKMALFEQTLSEEIPSLKQMYLEESISKNASRRASRHSSLKEAIEEDVIFPPLYEHRSETRSGHTMTIADVARVHYPEFSDLVFILTKHNTVSILDMVERRVRFELTDWPLKIKNLLVRRNLNYFRVVDPTKNELLQIKDLKRTSEGRISKSDVIHSSHIMLENVMRSNLSSLEIIKSYFQDLGARSWFHKEGIVDSYSMVLESERGGEIYFFNFKDKPTTVLPKAPDMKVYSMKFLKDALKKKRETGSKSQSRAKQR